MLRGTVVMFLFQSRLANKHVMSALKSSLGGRQASELSSDYEEFFLNNADDIAALVKKVSKSCPNTTPLTQLQAQQMVSSMIQVSQ